MAIQSRTPVVLLTRPAAQSQRFADQLQAAFGPLTIVITPLIAPEYLIPALPAQNFQALILTSETGAHAAGQLLLKSQALPDLAFCVGDRTAEVATKVGFRTLSAKGTAVDLIAMIQGQQTSGPLLHLHGKDSRGNVAQTLTKRGLETISVVCYDQRAQALNPEALDALALDEPLLVPLFSPRTAQIFAESLPAPPRAPLWIAALSSAVADQARATNPQHLVTAARPDADAMLHAVAELLDLTLGA